jgi:hypothetical protein
MDIINYRGKPPLRITGLFTLRGRWAARPPQRLGHYATLHSHGKPPPQFVGLVLLRKPSFRGGFLGPLTAPNGRGYSLQIMVLQYGLPVLQYRKSVFEYAYSVCKHGDPVYKYRTFMLQYGNSVFKYGTIVLQYGTPV